MKGKANAREGALVLAQLKQRRRDKLVLVQRPQRDFAIGRDGAKAESILDVIVEPFNRPHGLGVAVLWQRAEEVRLAIFVHVVNDN